MPHQTDTLRFLALGDSYTIGEGVPETGSWPVRVADSVSKALGRQVELTIIATTGWTTDELLAGIERKSPEGTYELVSLLIGVNNQYRGYDIEIYKREFEILLNRAIELSENKSRVFVLSIPDYGVTPFARDKAPEKIKKEIDQYNEMARECCRRYEIRYFDVTSISRKAMGDLSLIAEDGLHPSPKMYEKWADLVIPWVLERFK